jgi:hypothetical protein
MQILNDWIRFPGFAQKLLPEQIAQRSTWGRVPDQQMTNAAMHVISVVPVKSTTITLVNELDPGLYGETADDGAGAWFDPPAAYGHNAIHGRAMS